MRLAVTRDYSTVYSTSSIYQYRRVCETIHRNLHYSRDAWCNVYDMTHYTVSLPSAANYRGTQYSSGSCGSDGRPAPPSPCERKALRGLSATSRCATTTGTKLRGIPNSRRSAVARSSRGAWGTRFLKDALTVSQSPRAAAHAGVPLRERGLSNRRSGEARCRQLSAVRGERAE